MWNNDKSEYNNFTSGSDIKEESREEIRRLVAKAQSGDQKAFAKLLDIYEPLIASMISKFRIDGVSDTDAEDLRQEATLAFYSALVSYDFSISEVEFGLYAKVCICNRLVSQIRILKKHIDHSAKVSDPDELLHNLAELDDPSARIVELQQEKSLLKLINDNLSKYEQRVFKMYVSSMSNAEMAKKLGCSEKSVSNAVYRIRKKLKELLKNK